MDALFRFLASNEPLIYIFLGIAAFFNIRWLLRAWRDKRDAVFGLERDFANQRLTVSVGSLLVIFALFVSELILVSFVIPGLPSGTFAATPTADLLSASLIPPSGDGTTTPISEAPFGSVGCIPDQLIITIPRPGQDVSGIVNLTYTVNVSNMGFYKFEVAIRGSENWSTIFAGRDPQIDSESGKWDTSGLTPGDYDLRLVVTDNQGQELTPCVIPVRVSP